MRGHVLPWIYVAGFSGFVYGYAGYDPGTYEQMVVRQLPGIVGVARFAGAWAVVMILLLPVINRINDGRYDWRKVRTVAPQIAAFGALGVTVMFAGIGGYRLAGGLSGGWTGGWRAAGVGTLIGAALGLPFSLVAALLFRIAAWLGGHDPRAEPGAAPDPARVNASGTS
jgi:hypothetical protein